MESGLGSSACGLCPQRLCLHLSHHPKLTHGRNGGWVGRPRTGVWLWKLLRFRFFSLGTQFDKPQKPWQVCPYSTLFPDPLTARKTSPLDEKNMEILQFLSVPFSSFPTSGSCSGHSDLLESPPWPLIWVRTHQLLRSKAERRDAKCLFHAPWSESWSLFHDLHCQCHNMIQYACVAVDVACSLSHLVPFHCRTTAARSPLSHLSLSTLDPVGTLAPSLDWGQGLLLMILMIPNKIAGELLPCVRISGCHDVELSWHGRRMKPMQI